MRGQEPGEVVQSDSRIWLQLQSFTILRDGFFRTSLGFQSYGKLMVGFKPLRRQPHCLENTGTAPLKLYGLFYPAGSPAARSASR